MAKKGKNFVKNSSKRRDMEISHLVSLKCENEKSGKSRLVTFFSSVFLPRKIFFSVAFSWQEIGQEQQYLGGDMKIWTSWWKWCLQRCHYQIFFVHFRKGVRFRSLPQEGLTFRKTDRSPRQSGRPVQEICFTPLNHSVTVLFCQPFSFRTCKKMSPESGDRPSSSPTRGPWMDLPLENGPNSSPDPSEL